MALYSIIKFFGIVGFVLIVSTFLSGLLRVKFRYHKILAITTVTIIGIHAISMLTIFD